MKKKVLFSTLIIIIISGILIYINWSFTPLPKGKRNISTSNVRMVAKLEDVNNRTPIVKTYTKVQFDQFDEKEISNIKEIVSGNIEGDVPTLKIENGVGVVGISFEKMENTIEEEASTKLIPDKIPKIKMSVLETLYSEEEPIEISDSLIEGEEEGIYFYEIERYLDNEEIYFDEKENFYMESMYIEIHYKIADENYVSIFAINTLGDR